MLPLYISLGALLAFCVKRVAFCVLGRQTTKNCVFSAVLVSYLCSPLRFFPIVHQVGHHRLQWWQSAPTTCQFLFRGASRERGNVATSGLFQATLTMIFSWQRGASEAKGLATPNFPGEI